MADNIKTKNIKLNTNIDDEERIFSYFDNNKDNFSKVTKVLLLKYIDGYIDIDEDRNVDSKSIMKMLENNTKLLEQLIENGVKVDSSFSKDLNTSSFEKSKKDDNENNSNFNMDFLNQI
jgi:hypothetical protein